MCEATCGKNGFKGWDDDKLSDLVMSLVALPPQDLSFICCTVSLDDFRRAKPSVIPHVKTAAVVCAEWCFAKLRMPPVVNEPKDPIGVTLYYDSNEPFLRHVDKHWRSVPVRKRRGWKRQVDAITAVANAKRFPALQLARCGGMDHESPLLNWRSGELVARPQAFDDA